MDSVKQPKQLKQRDMKPPENIRKVAITMEGEAAQFVELDQTKPLAAIIEGLVETWKLADVNDYSLQFSDNNRNHYITERNRHEIGNGNVLKLTHSPLKTAQRIVSKLRGGSPLEKTDSLSELASLSADITFTSDFIGQRGHSLLIDMVEHGSVSGLSLGHLMKSFVQVMDSNIVSWENLQQKFIQMIGKYINNSGTEVTALQSALEIMESIILQSTTKSTFVEEEVSPRSLVHFLESGNPQIKKASLALINALFIRANKRKKMSDDYQSKRIRVEVHKHILPNPHLSGDMKHQLYVLQSLLLNMLEERMSLPADENDQESVKNITELRNIAFHIDSDLQISTIQNSAKRQSYAKDYKKLGFQNTLKPIEDFTETPPGVLALDTMLYFAKTYCENYKKVVLENSCKDDEHDCPIAKVSIHLTKMLCDILDIGVSPSEENQRYHPMFFTHDHPFHEFYCHCIQLLSKTWREMRATSQDFTKVLNVVKEQITRTLDSHPSSFEIFRNELTKLTYSEITNLWHQEWKMKDDWESKVRPVMELKEKLKPEIMELIKQQRLNCLMSGGMFPKVRVGGTRARGQWFCRLSPNMKVLHYGDVVGESTQPTIEQLSHKLAVVDIKSLLTGKDCSHYVRKGPAHVFTIQADTEDQSLNFIANSEHQFNIWTDGVNALLGSPMTSDQTTHDLETLLSMEIKLRLLDTEGVTIPEQPPPIPEDPPNFDFFYKY